MSFSFVRRLSLACILIFPIAALKAADPTPQNVDANTQASAIKDQIKKLNAADTIQREDAERELLKIGLPALPLLKEAAVSPEPEIAARAQRLVTKMTAMAAKPVTSYAEIMPASSVFFLEAPRARESLDLMKTTPLGKFWDLPASQKFYKSHRDGELPNTQKTLDAIREIPRLLTGKALLALGGPETAEAVELDPPLVYILETQQAQALEQQVRALFDGMSDPAKGPRKYGPFNIEEHITAQTVFGQENIIHSLTQVGIESFLNNLLKRPENPLSPLLDEIKTALPNFDFVLHLSSDGFKQLSDSAQLIDEDQIKLFDAAGFVAGSHWQSALKLNADGLEEVNRLTFGGGAANAGLLPVLAKMAATMPGAPQPGNAQALDMVPWQAALLFSFQGDISKNAAALSKALIAYEEACAPLAPAPAPVKPAPANKEMKGGKDITAPPNPNADLKDLVRKALEDAKAADKAPAKAGDKAAPKADNAEPRHDTSHVHLARFENMGLKLESILEQAAGPLHVALFLQQIDGEKAPETIPISPLYVMMLKDPKAVETALESVCAGADPHFTKEVLNGGTHYIEIKGDVKEKPGFWLKDNFLAYSTERDLLDLAGQALAHQAGTERMADRASYKQALAKKLIGPDALLTVFGEADQIFEMPYALARIAWQEDDANPWPSYADMKPLLVGKPVIAQVKAFQGGLQITGQSPLSLFGTFQAFRKPLKESGF